MAHARINSALSERHQLKGQELKKRQTRGVAPEARSPLPQKHRQRSPPRHFVKARVLQPRGEQVLRTKLAAPKVQRRPHPQCPRRWPGETARARRPTCYQCSENRCMPHLSLEELAGGARVGSPQFLAVQQRLLQQWAGMSDVQEAFCDGERDVTQQLDGGTARHARNISELSGEQPSCTVKRLATFAAKEVATKWKCRL